MRATSACLALAALTLCLSASSVVGQDSTGFIRVSNGQFVDDGCNRYVFSGYNTWQILETAGGACCGGRPNIGRQLDLARSNNLTVIRMFAYGTAFNYNLQLSATQYNASAWQDFDYILSESAKRGLKLTIALASNWVYGPNTTGTKCWYTNLTNTASDCDDFYTDANAITLYKNWIQAVTSRVNSINGLTYGADPTIFSWNLINEPRCDNPDACTAADIQSWIQEVAPYLKARVKQLVTVGEDGFMQASNCLADRVNPVTNNNLWPLQTGNDFLPNHAAQGIDYAAIHFWPDNWLRVDTDFGRNWLTAHSNLSRTVLSKPLVVEEFGKAFGGPTQTSGASQTQAQQVAYYQLVYSLVEQQFLSQGATQGIGFWRWDGASVNDLGAFDNYATINTTSPTFQQVVLPFSQRVIQYRAAQVTGCTPTTSTTAPTTAPSTSAAGRKLMQASAPSSALNPATINSQVPAALCTYYPSQPPSVG